MNSRPLLDYLAYPEDFPESVRTSGLEPFRASGAEPVRASEPAPRIDPLEARLKDLEARLRGGAPVSEPPKADLTLSAQIEAILRRKASLEPASTGHREALADHAARPVRIALDAPPTVPVANDAASVDQDFLRFSEAVYLIGQAAKRFIEEPQARVVPQPVSAAPSSHDIDALSAVLRETVSAFRSVADDLAVSAGEIRHYATREEREPVRRRAQPSPRYRDDDEIIELRESIADLQDRLDDLLHARRRRY